MFLFLPVGVEFVRSIDCSVGCRDDKDGDENV